MNIQWKFKVGDDVGYRETALTVIQKRLEFGEKYYRLSDGSIVHETLLY